MKLPGRSALEMLLRHLLASHDTLKQQRFGLAPPLQLPAASASLSTQPPLLLHFSPHPALCSNAFTHGSLQLGFCRQGPVGVATAHSGPRFLGSSSSYRYTAVLCSRASPTIFFVCCEPCSLPL